MPLWYLSSYVQYYALAVYAPISKSVSFGVKPGTCHVQLFVDAIKTLDEGPTDNEARAVVNLNKGWHQILVKSFQKKIQQGDVREGFNIRIDRYGCQNRQSAIRSELLLRDYL